MQKTMLFLLSFYHKFKKDTANERFVANGKSKFDSFENSRSSPQSKQVIGWCCHLQKCSSMYGNILKLDQEVVQSSVGIIRERSVFSF